MNNELRIGNWIQDGNEFEQITIDHLNCLNSGRCEYDPITLTEEWLLKFGFEKSESKFYYKKSFGVHLDFTAFNFQSCLWLSDNIKYVHQLQNLYFALTGEELILNI